MERLSLLIISILFCTITNAQDTIVKRNGSRILAKIIEVSTAEVKYKKYDFQDGPTFVESKSNIQLIKYSNGSQDKFEVQEINKKFKPTESNSEYFSGRVNQNNKIETNGNNFVYRGKTIKDRELHRILLNSNDQQIAVLIDRSRRAKKSEWIGMFGIPFAFAGIVSFGLGGLSNLAHESAHDLYKGGAICFAVAIPFPLIAIHYKHKHDAANLEAIRLYNEKY